MLLFALRSDGRCQAPMLHPDRSTLSRHASDAQSVVMTVQGSVPVWLAFSLVIGFGLGFLAGWKAHAAKIRYLRSKRDYYGGKALEYQRNLEQ